MEALKIKATKEKARKLACEGKWEESPFNKVVQPICWFTSELYGNGL